MSLSALSVGNSLANVGLKPDTIVAVSSASVTVIASMISSCDTSNTGAAVISSFEISPAPEVGLNTCILSVNVPYSASEILSLMNPILVDVVVEPSPAVPVVGIKLSFS